MINLAGITSHFRIEGRYISYEKIGSGHINDSMHILTSDCNHPGYLLQRINHHIFKNIPGLMNNISQVTLHIRNKISSSEPAADGLFPLMIIPTLNGSSFYTDEEGNFWRMYNYIPGTVSYDVVNDTGLAFEGGRVFGVFQLLTADLPAEKLVETIPDFHDIEFRLRNFMGAIARDPVKRVKEVQGEIYFVKARAEEMKTILKLGREGKIPMRVTHNDTKFNNILFDEDGRACCIVDLDTVMPGYLLYDFGDAIRTGANTASEDETDLNRVSISMEMFEAYTKGYLSVASGFLSKAETDHLAFSAKFMTFIIGLRFLTDHIDGDRYYRISREGHNLDRARVQFRLVESMEAHFHQMKEVINRFI